MNENEQYPWKLRMTAFILAVFVMLNLLSWLSIQMAGQRNPMYNYYSGSIFREESETIDVLVMGSSNAYSGVAPLYWWNSNGYTGYVFAEPAMRVTEFLPYLKKIYRKQSPKVVFLELGTLFRDSSDYEAVEGIVKGKLEQFFPVISLHRYLIDPSRLTNIGAKPRSLCKGYLIRPTITDASSKSAYMEAAASPEALSDISINYLKKTIRYCQSQGSEVVLLALPCANSWNRFYAETVQTIADEANVTMLDLNLTDTGIDWSKDSYDKGEHLNIHGAYKVSNYLANYLEQHYKLTDHREDETCNGTWNQDYQSFIEEIKQWVR